MTYRDVLKKIARMEVEKEKYAYFYGAKGEILTDDKMHELVRQYPAYFKKYSQEQLEEIYDYSRGKIGFDCSGFTTYVTGVSGNSSAQWGKAHNKTSNLVSGVAGSILYKTGHIGIDIGYGIFVHFPTEGHTIERQYISKYNWTGTGLAQGVDYTGSDNF